VIKSCYGKATAAIFSGLFVRRLPHDIQRRARAKLQQLEHAQTLDDLRIPPANMLEALKDDRAGQYSIRINRQWRICFAWRDGDAFDVEIVDYH
jgi:proteic killer suppression protein